MDFIYNTFCLSSTLIHKSFYTIKSNELNEQPIRVNSSVNNNDINGYTRIINPIIQKYTQLTSDPTLIDDRIYLGNAFNARNYYSLKNYNIGLIVNCTKEIPDNFGNEFEYINIPLNDILIENVSVHLEKCIDDIHNYLHNNPKKNVLVHCFMGASRSATFVIAYLIKYKKMSLNDAMEYVIKKRPIVNLNISFYRQLFELENTLRPLIY
jgi:hypothetical protein